MLSSPAWLTGLSCAAGPAASHLLTILSVRPRCPPNSRTDIRRASRSRRASIPVHRSTAVIPNHRALAGSMCRRRTTGPSTHAGLQGHPPTRTSSSYDSTCRRPVMISETSPWACSVRAAIRRCDTPKRWSSRNTAPTSCRARASRMSRRVHTLGSTHSPSFGLAGPTPGTRRCPLRLPSRSSSMCLSSGSSWSC
jgi:hypothetical protein